MATKAELDDLKAQWLADPFWDLEYTPGFIEHWSELKQFRLAHQGQGPDVEGPLRERCKALGIADTGRLMKLVEKLERR